MKSNIVIYWFLTFFFLLMAGVYVAFHFFLIPDFDMRGDMALGFWSGAIAISLTGGLSGFIAFFLQLKYRQQGGDLPEDLNEANLDDADPELGFFSPWSWWPILLAGSISLVVLGIAVGFWIAFYALPLLLISLTGWVYEYNRGNFAH